MKPVLFETHKTASEHLISVIKLNAPKSLNALNFDMVTLMQEHLEQVRNDPNVVAVVLDSTLEKAFCAGGDVVSIAKGIYDGDDTIAERFFANEYALDLTIHHYPKPIICLAKGIVLGGGMGLMNGSSHRVVTETTYMAMPEISIGLFPDVGGSWFLNKIPDNMGLFLGLTAAPMNAADARYLGLADFTLSNELTSQLVNTLCEQDWNIPPHDQVTQVLTDLQTKSQATCGSITSNMEAFKESIASFLAHDTLPDIINAIKQHNTDNRWLNKAQGNLHYGSPLSAKLIAMQLEKTKTLSLDEVFEFEYKFAVEVCKRGDFCEGVRALLIDKDSKPTWQYDNVTDIPAEFAEGFFN